MKRYLLCVLLLIASHCFSFQYQLTVCAIFQDDAKYLPEWIEFLENQGVEHFYLYNNLSTDDYQGYLKPYLERRLVTLTDWPYAFNSHEEWGLIQCHAYMNCVNRFRNETKWCAFIDTDEFLFSPNKKLTESLNEFEDYSGLVVNWMTYGTSNIVKIPENEKIVNYLLWRAPDNHEGHHSCKTIAKPEKVLECINPHFFLYKEGYAVNEAHQYVPAWRSPIISVNKFRINHYSTRDLDFFYTVKIQRRMKWVGEVDLFLQGSEILNSFYDPILLEHTPN